MHLARARRGWITRARQVARGHTQDFAVGVELFGSVCRKDLNIYQLPLVGFLFWHTFTSVAHHIVWAITNSKVDQEKRSGSRGRSAVLFILIF